MAQLSTIVRFLDVLLPPKLLQDSSINGLQVDALKEEVKVVALAVDSGQSVIEKAIAADADLLIVHHGLLWGQCEPIAGRYGRKIAALLRGGCSLYASHLPLDAHTELGNNAELARFFGLKDLQPAFEYKGGMIGIKATCPQPLAGEFFIEKAKAMVGAINPLYLPFGKEKIKSVGIVSGGAASHLTAAAEMGVDLFLSGEPKQEVYHLARELKINALFAGHYATETFGVRAVGRKLEKDFEIRTVFIDEATGI